MSEAWSIGDGEALPIVLPAEEAAASREYGSDEIRQIGMKEWAKSSPEVPLLTTKGLGPCIGIAAYDPTTKIGHMAHIAIPMFEQAAISDFLASIKATTGDINQLQLWVRGGQKKASMTGDVDMPQLGRDLVAGQLTALGLNEANMDIGFDDTPMGSRGTSMRLDTVTGSFETAVTISEEAAKLGSTALHHA